MFEATHKVAVTMPDGAIKEVNVSGIAVAKLCASFASELGLDVELIEIESK